MEKTPEQQAEEAKQKNRCELKIVVVKNGWVIKEGNNDWYAFNEFSEVVKHVQRYYGQQVCSHFRPLGYVQSTNNTV